jgi:hypothetical protein
MKLMKKAVNRKEVFGKFGNVLNYINSMIYFTCPLEAVL